MHLRETYGHVEKILLQMMIFLSDFLLLWRCKDNVSNIFISNRQQSLAKITVNEKSRKNYFERCVCFEHRFNSISTPGISPAHKALRLYSALNLRLFVFCYVTVDKQGADVIEGST